MLATVAKIVVLCVLGFVVIVFLIWMVSAPRKMRLAPDLEDRGSFGFTTKLIETNDPWGNTTGEVLFVRRVGQWTMVGPHTNYKEKSLEGWHLGQVRIDGFFRKPGEEKIEFVIGRYADRGSRMHGWHVVLVKSGKSELDLTRHQRFRGWMEKEPPETIDIDGTPKIEKRERHYFTGPADVVLKSSYQGYVEPTGDDLP